MNCFSGLHGSGLNALGYGVIRTGASTVRVFPLVFLVSPAQGLLLVCAGSLSLSLSLSLLLARLLHSF